MTVGHLDQEEETVVLFCSESDGRVASYRGAPDNGFERIPGPALSSGSNDVAFLEPGLVALADHDQDRVALFRYTMGTGWMGTGQEVEVEFPQWALEGDLEGDGKVDLIVVSQVSWLLTVFSDVLGPKPRRMEYELPGQPQCVAVADLDEHGGGEIIVSTKLPSAIRVYSLDSSGQISEKSALDPTPGLGPGASVEDLVLSDVDGDGHLDIVAVNFFPVIQIFHGGGNGSFQRFEQAPVPAIPRQVSVADMNLDGAPDLVVTTRGIGALGRDQLLVFKQDPWGGFLPPEPVGQVYDPVALETVDLDRDQRPDVLVLNRALNTAQIFLNRTLPANTLPPIVGSIPDLRLRLGQPLPHALDLDDYVVDWDTPKYRLHWSVRIWGDCPAAHIHSDHVVDIQAPTQTGTDGRVQFIVTDGRHRVARTIVVQILPPIPK